jgi:hypothetical protein
VSREHGSCITVAIQLTETCNVLDTDSAVASPSAERVDGGAGPVVETENWKERVDDPMRRHGESHVNRVCWLGHKARERDRSEYARKEEFVNLFECERAGLQRLALLLTANSEAAKQCLIRAFRECIAGSSVSKEWVLSWTRRMVIRNAISLVMGSEGESFDSVNFDADDELVAFAPDDSWGAIAGSEWVLDLPGLDRLVFVICVLERYAMYDCALLLGRSPRNINEARQRVANQPGEADELSEISRFALS